MRLNSNVKGNIEAILRADSDEVDTAIRLCLYRVKTQVFNDGSKRASV